MTSPCVFIEAFIDERLSAGLTLLPFPLLSLEQCAGAGKGPRVSGNGFAACASSQPLPDGNHGESVLQGASQ